MASQGETLPQDAQAIVELLKSVGVKEYEPRVVQQLTDFAYRYTSDVLQEAQAIAERAGAPRGQISAPDLLLATQTRAPHSFVPPPSQRTLRALAQRTNAKPLPALRERHFGVKLPPEADCLTAPNWRVKPSARQAELDALRRQQAAAAASRQQQQQQQQQLEGGGGEGGYGVRREARIGMQLPGAGWQPPPDAGVAEPFPQAAADGADAAAVAAAAAAGQPWEAAGMQAGGAAAGAAAGVSPMQVDGGGAAAGEGGGGGAEWEEI